MSGWRRRVAGVGMAGALGLGAVLVAGVPGAGAATAGAAAPGAPTSVDFSANLAVTVAGGPSVKASGTGEIDFSTDQLGMVVDVPGSLAPILKALPSSLAMATAGISGDTQVQAVVSGGTVYAQLPGLNLGGKDWVGVSFPTTAVSKVFASAGKALGNVHVILSALSRRGATIGSLGNRTVDGVPAVGYRATVLTAKILRLLPGLRSGAASTAAKDIGSTVPVQVWADAQGQVVQVSVSITRGGSATGVQSLNASVDFSGYGSAVTVTPPASTAATVIPGSTLRSLVGLPTRAHARTQSVLRADRKAHRRSKRG